MHMADALLSPSVGAVMGVVSAGAIGYSIYKMKKEDGLEEKLPIMAVSGAFVFAAQMINFTIPGTGSSGHIGGGILLASMLGGFPALLTLAAVLIIQCLFFADGGLLALGCNIFNMGVIPCLIIYPLIFKPILKKGFTKARISVAAILSVVAGLQLGAFGVVLETMMSGITELPFTAFVALMQPIHLAIGLVEGMVTAAILLFVHQQRPELLARQNQRVPRKGKASLRTMVIVFAAAALVVGGGVSLLASANPDGLEWAIEKTTGEPELSAKGTVFAALESVQKKTAIFPNYDFAHKKKDNVSGTTVAGIAGTVITFALVGAAGFLITRVKKRRKGA